MATRLLSIVLVLAVVTAAPAAQVRKEAPPEIRALVESVMKAANSGSAEAWEAFAQARFAPALLQQQSPDERAQLHQRIVNDLGTVELNGVRREGPDAPLQLNVKGTKGAGVIVVTIDESATPRITALRVELGAARLEVP